MSSPAHPRPYYYLENFLTALTWLGERYGDLLDEQEQGFIARFRRLPRESAALLVRMIGRKGELFRTAKLGYAEIGCPVAASAALIELGWLDPAPVLAVAELARLLRKAELQAAFDIRGAALGLRKAELIQHIGLQAPAPRTLAQWWPGAADAVFRLVVSGLCERLRLVFFGNFRQDWSQFVLSDLGIFRYEKVARDATRAFRVRGHIDTFQRLFECRKRLEEGEAVQSVLRLLPPPVTDNDWLETRRRKLQFQLGQLLEREGELSGAFDVYRDSGYRGSRVRMTRLLERMARPEEALRLAVLIREQPLDDLESQLVERMLPRLQRKAGQPSMRTVPPRGWLTFDLTLPIGERPPQLEQAAALTLAEPQAPVHYVENGLINSLLGLLCWEAVFAPVPGAFFHEFQSGPADLHVPGFRSRRAAQFARCFEQLESDAYRATIERNFVVKSGIQSPFVFWGLLSESLLGLALDCVPRAHLEACFRRILDDVRANRSGLPDLIQFWPRERRYRLIEVKGPGDRLQDNQLRWLTFCVSNGIPVSVCHVSWQAGTAPRSGASA